MMTVDCWLQWWNDVDEEKYIFFHFPIRWWTSSAFFRISRWMSASSHICECKSFEQCQEQVFLRFDAGVSVDHDDAYADIHVGWRLADDDDYYENYEEFFVLFCVLFHQFQFFCWSFKFENYLCNTVAESSDDITAETRRTGEKMLMKWENRASVDAA